MFITDIASGIKSALKTQPSAETMIPLEETKSAYMRWRVQIMASMFLGYAIFYFCRKNLSMAMPSLEHMGITKLQLGLMLTLTNFLYGLSKFVNGMIADHANPRYFMAIGLIASAIMNIIFGSSSMYWVLAVAWMLNGWFQGMGWPPCARQLTHWYHVTERGTWWGVWNASHQFGGAGIFVLSGWLIQHYGWRSAFYVPSVIAIITAIIVMITMRDTPRSVGLPKIEDYHAMSKGKNRKEIEGGEEKEEEEENEMSFKEILIKYVLKNKYLWYVCVANFFVYIVRLGVMDWIPMYLMQAKGSGKVAAGVKVAGFELSGIIGALVAGWLSDKIFKTNRGKVNVIYMAAVVALFYLFWFSPAGSFFSIAGLALIGFFIYGPQMLVGVSAADFASKRAAATATGLTGLFGYMGASIVSGVGTGYMVEKLGWIGGFYLFVGAAVIGMLLFTATWRVKARQ